MTELSGEFAGRYRIDEQIGEGGMGTVYRAFDLKLERAVALKVLTEKASQDPASRTRFLKEIATTASLSHPYIVPVYEGDIEDDRFFFTMELIEGSDLGVLCRSKPMEADRAIAFLRQVAGALQFIHNKGYVHRDVKPTNVLIWGAGDEWETAKLADFGIARVVAEDSQLTKAPPGSFPYMPPEAVKWEEPSPQSDQYSLGVMAFEMLSGHRPFADENLPKAHCDEPVPSLHEAAKNVPPSVCDAIERALAKAPSDRFPDIASFAAALISAPAASPRPRVSTSEPPSLQDEVADILGHDGGKWVQIAEIADEINSRGRQASEVREEEIDRHTKIFTRRFRRRGSAVQLR